MFKENGRFKPAKKEELANLKGKNMICPKCQEYSIVTSANFSDIRCSECGTVLVEVGMSAAGKATGK